MNVVRDLVQQMLYTIELRVLARRIVQIPLGDGYPAYLYGERCPPRHGRSFQPSAGIVTDFL